MSILNTVIARQVISGLRQAVKNVKYAGKSRFCPVCCRYSSTFAPFGIVPRDDAQCVWCGALERHRLLWLYLQRKTDIFLTENGKKMLHVAPERCLEARFRQALGKGYLTADLFADGVDVKMDICEINYPDNSFDVIYCSHVLEHVPDDRKAMREFQRVLNLKGWAILLVPITVQKTIEDASVSDPNERLRLFGQEDHIRRYGADYQDRLNEAGFEVECILPKNFISPKEIELMAITPMAGEIYLCRKNGN